MNEMKVSANISCKKRNLPESLHDEYDKLFKQIKLESELSGVNYNRIIFKWLLEGAKNGC